MAIFDLELSDAEMKLLDEYTSEPEETYSFTCNCAEVRTCGPHGGGYTSRYAGTRPLPP